ncbi:hypothetical protein F511_19539 [Dorcoceras hygrometricum]|uniref:Uncharacterized protein n=1 Tax=Dorcoceras hygrometricum TaxID=472368 RepID=A0A2Z7BZP0_9LAMI|nr:hypothetical protein F511_19539 [Dorcoceras hygrometricum]
MASMSNEMQRRFEKTKYAADILFHLKELYGENSRHERFTAVKELMTRSMRDGTSVREHGFVRASGNTALSSPCWDRSHHAPSGNPGSTAGRGFNPAGGAPGGG